MLIFREKSLTLGLETLRVRLRRNQTTSTSENARNQWKLWKRMKPEIKCEKLLIPLPIPHPAHIAISIYNRDSDTPIPIDSDLCWDILRSIEECYGDIEALNSVTRYHRGRGSETTGLDSTSNDSLDSTCSSGGEIKDIDSRESLDGTETLPCARSLLPNNAQITITSNNVQDIAESITSGVNVIGNLMSHSNSSNSITPTNTSYHWTLSNLESSDYNRRNRNISGGNNNSNSNNNNNNVNDVVRVDLASPEDISMDEQRVVLSSSSTSYGTTV
jgi:hypothetical protein